MLEEVDNSVTQKKIIIQRDTNTKTDIFVLDSEFGTTLKPLDFYKIGIREEMATYGSIYSYSFAVASTSSQTKILPIQQEHRQIIELPNKNLKKAIFITVEPDEDGFIAKTIDLPLYGYGNNREDAINELKYEIESLYDDLMVDDDFTGDWLNRKKLLKTWMKD